MDTIVSFDQALTITKDLLLEADKPCQVEMYTVYAEVFQVKLMIDSANYFVDKAIQLGRSIGVDIELVKAFGRKALILIKEEKIDEAEAVLTEARTLLKGPLNNSGWINYYNKMSFLADVNADYQKAIAYSDSTIIVIENMGDSSDLSVAYHNLGVYYFRLTNYEKAAENLLLALRLKEKIPNADVLGTYFVLGVCYNKWKQFETADHYLQIAYELAEKSGDSNLLLSSYIEAARAKRGLKRPKEAEVFLDSVLVIAHELESAGHLSDAYILKAGIYFWDYKFYEQAEELITKAYKYAKLTGSDLATILPVTQSIQYYLHKKNYQKAKLFLEELEGIAERLKGIDIQVALHDLYSQYYEAIGKPELALENLKTYYLLNDSIANKDVKTQVAALEKKYDSQKKELEITKLNLKNEEQAKITRSIEFRQYLFLGIALLLGGLITIGIWVFIKVRKQQIELELAHSNLQNLNDVKNRLFSIIAHDLRGMILPFQRVGKILKYHIDKGNYDRTLQLSQELEKNSNSLSAMLDNLLQWSLEQMNGYTHNPTDINVHVELNEIAEGYKQQADFKNNTIRIEAKSGLVANFDKGAFHVIFRNLIANALKFTENGSILLVAQKVHDRLEFTVRDSGLGMDVGQLDKLFNFNKSTSTVGTKGEKGVGLGLSLVHRFVEIHKGTIDVHSEVGKGTRFTLSFPLD